MKNNWISYSITKNLIKVANKNKKIIVLDADLADDLDLYKFKENFPKRFIQNGIAEQDMVSMAGGLALNGLLPVVNSFAAFLTARANEQIYNNSTENTKIIYLSLYAGLLPAGAGKSHQSLRDISALSSIPNMKIFHPLNYKEAEQILNHCIYKEKYNSSIRLSIGPPPVQIDEINKKIKFKYGEGNDLIKGKDILVFCYGQYMVNEVLKAVTLVKNKNRISCEVSNISSINYFDLNWYKNKLKKFDKILIIDDHNINGGLGDLIISFLVNKNLLKSKKIIKIGIKNFPKCGTQYEVLKFHELDYLSITKKIKELYYD